MKAHSYDGKLSVVARLFLFVSVTVITIASFLGADGVMMSNYFLLKLHPYIFFIGFGNLAILILNNPRHVQSRLKFKRHINLIIRL